MLHDYIVVLSGKEESKQALSPRSVRKLQEEDGMRRRMEMRMGMLWSMCLLDPGFMSRLL